MVTPATPAAYDPAATYQIKVARVILVNEDTQERMRPMNTYRMTGAAIAVLLTKHPDAIASATVVPV